MKKYHDRTASEEESKPVAINTVNDNSPTDDNHTSANEGLYDDVPETEVSSKLAVLLLSYLQDV